MRNLEQSKDGCSVADRGATRRPGIPGAKATLSLKPALRAQVPDEDPQRDLELARIRIERLEQEVAQLRRAVADERRYAYFDALTGLPNRSGCGILNRAISGNSRQYAGSDAIWRGGVFDGQEVGKTDSAHA